MDFIKFPPLLCMLHLVKIKLKDWCFSILSYSPYQRIWLVLDTLHWKNMWFFYDIYLAKLKFMAWFSVSYTFCTSESNIHLRKPCALASRVLIRMQHTPFWYLISWSDWIYWMISVLDFTKCWQFDKYHGHFSILKFFTPSTDLWLLHVNFNLGRHQSTFYSSFNHLVLCFRGFVCYVNNAFYNIKSGILNNASQQLS